MATYHYNTRSRSRSVGLTKSNLICGHEVKARTSNKHKNPSILIFEDSDSGCVCDNVDDEPSVAKKRAKLSDVTAVASNVRIDSRESDALFKPTAVKKIVLASDEHGMNGAPEGDLYDVKVLDDENLRPCSEDELKAILLAVTQPITDNWAGQFDQMSSLRQLLLHHRDQLHGEHEILAASFIIAGVESLRSTTLRNGLHCMRQFINTAASCSNQGCLVDIIQCLIKRCHTGPRFLVSVAESNIPIVLSRIRAATIIEACQRLISNKNLDIVKRAFIIICTIQPHIKPEDSDMFRILLSILSTGLNAKSVEVRSSCKKCFCRIKNSLPVDIVFKDFLLKFVSDPVASSIDREVTSMRPNLKSEPISVVGFRKGLNSSKIMSASRLTVKSNCLQSHFPDVAVNVRAPSFAPDIILSANKEDTP